MKNLKIILLITCFLGSILTYAQEVITSGGDYLSHSNGSMSITIGEPIGETFITPDYIMTQGFQQSKLTISSIYEIPGSTYSVSAFPNPTKDFIKLKIENCEGTNFSYALFDINGKLIKQEHFNENENDISFKNLPHSTYYLRVMKEKLLIKTLKIVKQ